MCGIAGSLGIPFERAGAAVEHMRKALAHRGPDDQGTEVLRSNGFEHPVILAHNRLAIIDPSPAGHQPMLRDGNGIALSFNGEVYNFQETQAELKHLGDKFVTSSDSEVILAAYRAWGPESVQRMRGMFAWALADARRGEVWFCRDRLGIKPLYVARPHSGGVLFASEVRALLAAGPELVPRRASPAAIESFLSQGMVCGFGAIVEGVSLLPPATSLILDWEGRELTRARYWQVPFRRATEENGVIRIAAVTELRDTLREAVRLHLIADVPLGIFLSGGVDSSAIATVANEVHRGGIHTLSVGFDQPEFDETRDASELAREIGTEHTVLSLSGPELLSDIDHVFAAMDQPTVDGFNTYVVSRAAREAGLTVALSGLGGDELFGGYASFRDVPRATTLRRFLPLTVRLPDLAHVLVARLGGRGAAKAMELFGRPRSTVESYLLRRELLLPTERGLLRRGAAEASSIEQGLSDEIVTLSEENQVSALELNCYMRDMLLRDADVFSMAVSLELRVPLLDHPLVEAVARLPGRWKVPDPRPKPLLLDAVGPTLPASVAQRRKRGFTFPWDAWLRGPMRDRVTEAMQEADIWRSMGITPETPMRLLTAFLAGNRRVGGLQIVALWVLREYVARHGLVVA
jgi:asparagine synthase (glutamine-hydrolysing)